MPIDRPTRQLGRILSAMHGGTLRGGDGLTVYRCKACRGRFYFLFRGVCLKCSLTKGKAR